MQDGKSIANFLTVLISREHFTVPIVCFTAMITLWANS